MIKKIAIGLGVLIGFIIACTGVATMQMIMGAFINNNAPDPDGKLDPDPQVKAKQEWEAKLKDNGQSTSSTKEEPTTQPTEATPQQTPPVVEQPVAPQPAPAPPPPRALTTGPGNFDAPPAYYAPSGATGPGNM